MIMPKLVAPAPLLEKLYISIPQDAYHQHPKSFCIFGGDAPRLRHLELHNYPWIPQIPLTSLTHLTVHNPGEQFFSTKAFVAKLQEMNLLQTISLKEEMDDHTGIPLEPWIDGPVTKLPHLSSLYLCGNQLRCAYVLSHLSFPSDISLRLSCKVSAVSGDPNLPRVVSIC